MERRRRWFILSLIVAIAAIVVLVSGLSSLELGYEGQRLPQMPRPEEEAAEPPPQSGVPEVVEVSSRILFIVAGALLPFAIILYLASPRARKRALRDLIALLIILVPLYLLWRAQPATSEALGGLQALEGMAEELPPAPDVTYAPQPRQWLLVIATVVVALLVAAVLVAVVWMIWNRRQRPSPSLDRLAQEAQDAIDAIEAGADLKDTVTRCYFEMMQVLKEERGIKRQEAMTPREFEAELEELGVPTTQVRRLTRLFEAVRYGGKELGREEERQAVVSLTSIVRSCKGTP